MLHDLESARSRCSSVLASGSVSTALRSEVSGFFSSCATSAAKRSMASMLRVERIGHVAQRAREMPDLVLAMGKVGDLGAACDRAHAPGRRPPQACAPARRCCRPRGSTGSGSRQRQQGRFSGSRCVQRERLCRCPSLGWTRPAHRRPNENAAPEHPRTRPVRHSGRYAQARLVYLPKRCYDFGIGAPFMRSQFLIDRQIARLKQRVETCRRSRRARISPAYRAVVDRSARPGR
jgi:hypothetical protein